MKVVVVGAGLAGLASAISCAQAGAEVVALDRSPTLEEVGAGLALTRNAVAALAGLGIERAQVEAAGFPTRAEGNASADGRMIMKIAGDAELNEKTALIGMHRRRLHSLLLARAKQVGVKIRTGVKVTEIDPGAPAGSLAQVAGESADLAIGADGMFSTIRSLLFSKPQLKFAGFSCWRAITPRTSSDTLFHQYWGSHAEFGYLPVHEDETYWYGYVKMAARTPISNELAAAQTRFASWHQPITELLARTDAGAVIRHDIYYLPGGLASFTRGRVVMVGDAAHGTLPTMGQGAASALEDGASLGPLVVSPAVAGGDLARAMAGFDAVRRPRSAALGRASLLTARMGSHLGGTLRQSVRNKLLSLTPASLMSRAADASLAWEVPPAAEPQ